MALKNFRERSPVIIGIISIILIMAGTTFAFFIDRLPFVKQAYEIEAEFTNASGIVAENQVRVAGIKVGTVKEVNLVRDRVAITMEIENGIEIPADASASIKLATLLGTKFIDIQSKGSDPYLEEGDKIPLERTTVPYEIFQVSNEGTRVLEGINGPLLNNMLVELAKLTRATKDELGNALSGLNELGAQLNEKEIDFKSLLANADDLTKLLSDEGDEIVRLIDASNEVLGSLAGQREEIQSLLESTKVMAGQLTDLIRDNRGNLDNILVRLNRALLVLEKNVDHIDVALEYAGPSSRYLASMFQQGPWGDIYSCAIILSVTCEVDEGT